MMKKILLTGFEAFSDWDVNPTEIAVTQLDGLNFEHTTIVGKIIPLKFYKIREKLRVYVNDTNPVAILMTGQAGGDKIRLEKIAKNKAKSNIPYNCGTVTNGELLSENGPEELFSTLPLEEMYTKLKSEEIPVRYSESAGLFGCNQIFYLARLDYPDIPSGFIHVPLLPKQASNGKPSMEQDMITRAIELSTRVLIRSVTE